MKMFQQGGMERREGREEEGKGGGGGGEGREKAKSKERAQSQKLSRDHLVTRKSCW